MRMFNQRFSKKGFSIIELMVVIAIIGILAAIAIPSYMGVQKRAKRSEFKTNLEILRLLEEKYYAENSVYLACAGGTQDCIDNFSEFRPGDPNNLLYIYSTTLTNGGQGFLASAKGTSKSPDLDVVFSVDENNNRTNW